MKNGAFITIQNIYDEKTIKSNSGVVKKILSQYKVLKQNYNIRLDIFEKKNKNLFFKILERTPFYPVHCHWKIIKDYSDIDFLYIRMETIDYFFIDF